MDIILLKNNLILLVSNIVTLKAQQTKFKVTNKIEVFFRFSKYFATKPITFANVMAIVYQNISNVILRWPLQNTRA
jgi:hypothetical protein